MIYVWKSKSIHKKWQIKTETKTRSVKVLFPRRIVATLCTIFCDIVIIYLEMVSFKPISNNFRQNKQLINNMDKFDF